MRICRSLYWIAIFINRDTKNACTSSCALVFDNIISITCACEVKFK